MADFERNTTGFTADVEQYDDDTLVKIYRDYVPQADIDREILCTRCVQGQGLPVPEFRGYITYQDKRAILLEYIRGESMMKVLTGGAVAAEELADDFADIHFKMHRCKADGLEKSKVRFERLLRLSEPNLGTDLTTRCLKLLDKLPEGESLCHNDFHPGNIIYGEKGMTAIDWSDATSGNALSDLARTVQMFDYGPTACSKPIITSERSTPERQAQLRSMKDIIERFTRRYEARYVKLMGMDMRDYEELVLPWKVVVPATRFNIEWDCNKPRLLKLFYEYFMEHPIK